MKIFLKKSQKPQKIHQKELKKPQKKNQKIFNFQNLFQKSLQKSDLHRLYAIYFTELYERPMRVLDTAMGVTLNAQSDPTKPYVQSVARYCTLAWEFNINPAFWFKPIWYLFGGGFEALERLKILKGFTQRVRQTWVKNFSKFF